MLPRLDAGSRRALSVFFFGLLPLVVPVWVIVYVTRGASSSAGQDFDLHTLWVAGRDVAHGVSPYPFVYPAPAAVMMTPIGVLPWRAAVAVFFVLSVASMFGALRILGVRDWRCYGACLIALPTASAVGIGTLSPMLALAAACVWRWRDRRAVVAAALTFAVVTKLFLWPLFVWLLATRRLRTAVASGVTAVAVTVGGWAVIGFAGLTSYPHHLGGIATIEEYKSFSTVAFVHTLGLTGAVAHAATLAVGLTALGAVVLLARRPGGELASFSAAIGAALLISPIVWVHYLVLLYVPIAVTRRRLGPLWLAPLALWVLPGQESYGSIPRLLFVFCLAGGVLAAAAARELRPPALRRPRRTALPLAVERVR
jgi:alpha-1,2-mannosyltransferase